jgi:hypothetical protein
LTEGTAYTWGKVENTFILQPRNGSKLAYSVTLGTEGLTVEQAVEAILEQQPTGSHIGLAITVGIPARDGVDPMPWLSAKAVPLTLSAVTALEALCRVTAGANPDSVWELAGMRGARSLGLLCGPSRPDLDPQATAEANSAGMHPVFPPALGPALERAIQLRSQSAQGSALDLDSGRVLDLPVGSENWSAQQRRSWLYDQHLELAVAWEEDRWCLLAAEVTLKVLPADRRASPSIAQLRYALASGKDSANSPVEAVIVPEAFVRLQLRQGLELPCALAFQTAAGQFGLLELVSVTKGPHTLHVRCRFVQGSVQEEMSLKER